MTKPLIKINPGSGGMAAALRLAACSASQVDISAAQAIRIAGYLGGTQRAIEDAVLVLRSQRDQLLAAQVRAIFWNHIAVTAMGCLAGMTAARMVAGW